MVSAVPNHRNAQPWRPLVIRALLPLLLPPSRRFVFARLTHYGCSPQSATIGTSGRRRASRIGQLLPRERSDKPYQFESLARLPDLGPLRCRCRCIRLGLVGLSVYFKLGLCSSAAGSSSRGGATVAGHGDLSQELVASSVGQSQPSQLHLRARPEAHASGFCPRRSAASPAGTPQTRARGSRFMTGGAQLPGGPTS